MRMPVPFFVSLGMLLTMTFLSVGLWSVLPPETMLQLPFASPDGLSPTPALFVLPAIMLVGILGFALYPRLSATPLTRPGLHTALWLLMVLVLVVGHGLVIRQALFALRALQG